MEAKKRNTLTGVGIFLALSFALFLDIKYKGIIYRAMFPKKVQS